MMENDPYVWMDPFEEVARANARTRQADLRANQAREAGQRDITCRIEEMGEPEFRKYLYAAIAHVADKLAHEIVLPELRSKYLDARQYEARLRAERDFIMTTMALPLATHLSPATAFSVEPWAIPDGRTTVEIRAQTVRPVDYHYRLDLH